ncbi:hemicentin-2-like isoform X5 [Macrosteles quadrilineatus]|uniref:hemicentin-2-like isoform X5 n=1 Tax=Macrosteles quadrilineatus TaxID=74068 RepID=UPI0023E1A311|nr:hemicentin-2-like isoform X5 [Macrosteles quadrilineatus]
MLSMTFRILIGLLLILGTQGLWRFTVKPGVKQRDMKGLVGETIQLPCSVNTETCGDLHSIKWYRGSSRIYVFSEMAGIARAEGEYSERAELQYTPNSTVSHLKVRQLQVADEAVYKCEITYLEVREGCQVVQFINLITLIKPNSVTLFRTSLAKDNELKNATKVGPLSEDDELLLICETEGGKPTPSVQWWNGSSQIHGDTEVELQNGQTVARKKIKITISRGDLGARYECRVQNDALESPLVAYVDLDVYVRPLSLNLSGVEHHVVQGTNVLLQCLVVGARPAATITWYNGTNPIPANSTERQMQRRLPKTKVFNTTDGTFDTVSSLSFTATRFENGGSLTCEATNDVMESRNEVPMRDNIKLEVMYPPIVTVYPENITVNESMNITILCHYEANPSTLRSIKWLRNNEVIKAQEGGERSPTGADEDSVDGLDGTVLTVKTATRNHHGIYTCMLENEVGVSTSSNEANVSVYYKPIVNLTTNPPTPVSELDHQNITLLCQVYTGYPDTLLAVRWYLDGELLKELPECGASNATLCDIDPSKLLLEEVERRFHGNYSCAGMNEAGWGPISAATPVIVYYPPGDTSLVYTPNQVKKKGSVTLMCSVRDEGRPPGPIYRWLRGGHLIHDVTSANWTIDPVTLETESNFTCIAENDGGQSVPATVAFKVLAPPNFIERPHPYFGARWNDQYINLTCRVECSPLCTISWTKNGRPIDKAMNNRYDIREVVERSNPTANIFESVRSTLIWNMSAWPGAQLDRLSDNANYSCHSSGNLVGAGVNSTTTFGVEYPPENVTVTNKIVNVTENNIPPRVLCSAKAFPEASYNWSREGDSDVVRGNALILNFPMQRHKGGNYVCTAYNKHGSNTQTTFFNVLYKPECGITQTEVSGKMVLICTATANPADVDFTWKVKNENETIEDNIEKVGLQSFLTLETRVENFRTYLCVANNSVGSSIPCERDVTAYQEKSSKFRATGNISWWHRLENDNLMILLAVIAGIILVVIIICVIIIIVCRRRRAADKYNNPVELEDRQNPDGTTSPVPPVTPPKWPLRPGVLVHVNTNHSLSLGRLPAGGGEDRERQRRTTSLASVVSENQHTRAQRIKNMFSDHRNKLSDTMPGIYHGESGVITFKKIDPTATHGTSRKRKKPGKGPNPSTTKDKSDLNSSPSDALLQTDPDNKAFYENLPFHGMQNPPNKPDMDSSEANPPPRPPSAMSQFGGSSGYGSTRSHVGPHLNAKENDEKKFGSLRSCKRCRSDWPQFRSLRTPNRKKMLPIKEGSPEAKSIEAKEAKESPKKRETNSKGVKPPATPVRATSTPVPPTPAPRKTTSPTSKQSSTPKHTYQNVPIPITPNNSSNTDSVNSTNEENPHLQLTNSPMDRQRLLNPINGRQSLKKQRSRQPPPPGDEYYHHQGYMLNNGTVVYADLALNHQRPRQYLPQHVPLPVYHHSRPHTEYAVIKFHDVGQEIDV